MTNQPLLSFSSDSEQPEFGSLTVRNLDPYLLAPPGSGKQAANLLRSILRVTVAQTGLTEDDSLPDISGHYQIVEGGLRFTPHFPFEPGLTYQASFAPRPLGRLELQVLTLEFSLPRAPDPSPTAVKHIFPSGDCLPENLLRFYVGFSNSMQRGRAEAEISVLGPDGEPVPDVLYRAPVELWDRGMQNLTILLDPGRLKRGVGPNRELGPPLRPGQVYTLAVGAGMLDLSGRRLIETVHKRFRVTEAVRQPIAVEDWEMVPPRSESCEPVVLLFPRPLDWALLGNTISTTSTGELPVAGRLVIDQCERRWSFTPTSPWAPGSYQVRIASSLEDVCGNSVIAAFDRPLRSGNNLPYEAAARSIPFDLE